MSYEFRFIRTKLSLFNASGHEPVSRFGGSAVATVEMLRAQRLATALTPSGRFMITGCEACSETAEIPFDYILDWLTGSIQLLRLMALKINEAVELIRIRVRASIRKSCRCHRKI